MSGQPTGAAACAVMPEHCSAMRAMRARYMLMVMYGNGVCHQCFTAEAAKAAAAERIHRERTYTSKPKHVILAGWDSNSLSEILHGFAEFCPAGTHDIVHCCMPKALTGSRSGVASAIHEPINAFSSMVSSCIRGVQAAPLQSSQKTMWLICRQGWATVVSASSATHTQHPSR